MLEMVVIELRSPRGPQSSPVHDTSVYSRSLRASSSNFSSVSK